MRANTQMREEGCRHKTTTSFNKYNYDDEDDEDDDAILSTIL